MNGTIEICGLTKRYGQLDALAGIDLDIGSGDFFSYRPDFWLTILLNSFLFSSLAVTVFSFG